MVRYKLILPVQFSLGQFYVAKTRSYGRIVPGVNCGKNNNLSLKENTSPKKNFIPDTIVGRRGSSTFTCLIGTFTFNVTGVWLENDLLVFAIGSHGGPPDAGGLPQCSMHYALPSIQLLQKIKPNFTGQYKSYLL